MTGWAHQWMFDGQLFAELVIKEAIRKKEARIYPKINYQTIVYKIAEWLSNWLSSEVPKPSELVALLTDGFLMVMKAKRKKLTPENFLEFLEALKADVMKEISIEFVRKGKGIRETYQIK